MKKQGYLSAAAATAAIFALGYAVFYALMQRPASDISIHATWAAEIRFTDLRSFFHHGAHPLWHTLVALVLLTGLPLAHSAALVTALCKAAEVWLLIALAAQLLGKRGWAATLCGAAASLVSALWVPALNPLVYVGIGSPNPWHSPTQLIAMVPMLLAVPLTARCVDSFRQRLPLDGPKANAPARDAALLGALLLLSLTAKPTFMQAFLPAASLYCLLMWLRKPRNSPFFLRMMAAAAPAVVLMVLQYLFYFGVIVPSQGNMILDVSLAKAGSVALAVLLTQAFPILVLAACSDRETWRSPLVWLTLATDIVAILEMLLLGEDGRRAADGNFGWAMMGAALMLWAIALPLYARFARRWARRRRAAAEGQPTLASHPRLEAGALGAGALLLAWHLASGIYYVVYLLTTGNAL